MKEHNEFEFPQPTKRMEKRMWKKGRPDELRFNMCVKKFGEKKVIMEINPQKYFSSDNELISFLHSTKRNQQMWERLLLQ